MKDPYRDLSKALRTITRVIKLVAPHTKGEEHDGLFVATYVDLDNAHRNLTKAIKNHKKETGYTPKKRTKTPARQLYDELNGKGGKHGLWAKLVIAQADGVCEYCHHKKKVMQAHHIYKKPNYWLRFDLRNGICLCSGCHKFVAHQQEVDFMYWCEDTFRTEKVGAAEAQTLKNRPGKPDLSALKIAFTKELERLGC